MKLYFTLTDGVDRSPIHLDMLRLACKSAKENTSLKLCALYDGTPNDTAYKILREYGVDITLCSCSFADKLEKYYTNVSPTDIHAGIKRLLGCFMKFDIALHENQDEVVLYADIDTMFLKDVDWDAFKVKTLAVAPEFDKNYDIINGYKYFNAGIMIINIPEAKKRMERLFYMLDNYIEPYQECWDQGFWNELYKDDFESLPIEFNWKPYWGINEKANIIHIHGFKLGSLSQNDAHFCCGQMQRFSGAYDGWIFYTIKAYRLLGYNKDLQITQLVNFLNDAKFKTPNKKQWYFSTYWLHFIYEKLKKHQNHILFSHIWTWAEKKLQKRHIL